MEARERWALSAIEERQLRFIVAGSASLSLVGTGLVIVSVLRFRELSKRFFAIRLITCLALTDGFASLFNIVGAFVDPAMAYRSSDSTANAQQEPSPALCQIQAVGLLYFNLSSIFWTSCFALTLYRDMIHSYTRGTLRKYEVSFHLVCWPVPAVLAGLTSALGYLGDAGPFCALGPAYAPQYLLSFYVPLLSAFFFNLSIYALVWRRANSRRVSRTTSLYLLVFGVVWAPSLLVRVQVLVLGPARAPSFPLAALEALCMPLQGALNAAVYGWSLPRIRDMYRTMLLGIDSLDAASILRPNSAAIRPSGTPTSEYSPPTSRALSDHSSGKTTPDWNGQRDPSPSRQESLRAG